MQIFLLISIALYLIAGTDAAPLNNTSKLQKRVCQSTVQSAVNVAHALQDHYYSNGGYTDRLFWTEANIFETLINVAELSGDESWANIVLNGADVKVSNYKDKTDDAGWGVLLYIRAADHVGFNTDAATVWKNNANELYEYMAAQWDDAQCGGGVWWDPQVQDYKNTISNALFLHVSAAMGIRFPSETKYRDNAVKTWNWLKNSGLRDSADGLWKDGIHPNSGTCAPEGTKNTYNQGVVISGVGVLKSLTGDASLLDEGDSMIDSAKAGMTMNGGILFQICDDVKASTCDNDARMFKGIFMKHVMYYIDQSTDKAAKYADFIWAQSSAVTHFATGADGVPGSVWYAPNEGGSVFDPRSAGSGLDAHVAAAKYGTCEG